MKRLIYREGSWFAVPLGGGGYSVGVVARMAPRGRIVCGYLFGPRREFPPALAEFSLLRPNDAIRCLRLGDLGLINGEWPVIGELPEWRREEWPIPPYIRRNELSRRAWRCIYSADDPSKIEREEPVPYDANGLESDGLCGYGFVEDVMTKLLAGDQKA